jgi:hypothetical protein
MESSTTLKHVEEMSPRKHAADVEIPHSTELLQAVYTLPSAPTKLFANIRHDVVTTYH